MKWKTTSQKTRLYLIAAVILLVGLGSAILIYLTADKSSDSVLDYENSKMYIHDMELYGGKGNVLADEIRRWFVGLWQGESLAFTIAGITIIVAFGFLFVAHHLPDELKSGPPGRNDQAGSG